MKTKEQIKQDFEQNHYRKQRELIDAGKLNYWELSEENKKGILQQCKDEGKKYRNLRWMATESSSDNDPAVGTSSDMMFHFTEYYYRRLDPLPEEESEDAELRATIKLLEKDLKEKEKRHRELRKEKEKRLRSTLDDLRKEKQLRSRVEENAARLSKEKYAIQKFVDSAAEDVERYEGEVIKLEEDLKGLKDQLEKKNELIRENINASTSRLNQIHELNGELQKLYDTLDEKEALLDNYRKEEASLYRDIRILAMKLA